MRICILGASGNTGRRLVRQALDRHHQVTAVVRHRGGEVGIQHERLRVIPIDYTVRRELISVMSEHDAVVCAAGHLSERDFPELVRHVVGAAEEALGRAGRLWMFAGAALTDVPGTSTMTMDLPGVPAVFHTHRTNYNTVKDCSLDWSILCPGPMIASPDGEATKGIILSKDSWPLPRPTYTKVLPRIALSVAFRSYLSRLTIYYEDAAAAVLDHLAVGGPYSLCRVGIALPEGVKRKKEGYSTRPMPAGVNRRV